MAVPFNLPEDFNEVGVILNQLQSLLTQLQVAWRESHGHILSPGNSLSSTLSRVRNQPGTRRNSIDDENEETDSQTPELINNLAWLASISQENSIASSQLTMIPVGRTARFRTTSDCDETKINITTIVNAGSLEDLVQIGVALRKIADDFTPVTTREEEYPSRPSSSKEGILSKLPDKLTCSIWTAMLGCVGWHLFRAR